MPTAARMTHHRAYGSEWEAEAGWDAPGASPWWPGVVGPRNTATSIVCGV
jgi:hypothetical protein